MKLAEALNLLEGDLVPGQNEAEFEEQLSKFLRVKIKDRSLRIGHAMRSGDAGQVNNIKFPLDKVSGIAKLNGKIFKTSDMEFEVIGFQASGGVRDVALVTLNVIVKKGI